MLRSARLSHEVNILLNLQLLKNYIKREVGVVKNLYSGTFKHFAT